MVSAFATAKIPDSVSFVDAAAIPAAGLTAMEAIQRLSISSGDVALITGAGGGVGGYALQLAKLRGARVIATDADGNADRVRGLGADEFLDFQTENIPNGVRSITGGIGVGTVLDTVGTPSAPSNVELLRYRGRIATTAGRLDISVVAPFSVWPSTHDIALGAAFSHGDQRNQKLLGTNLTELLRLLGAGKLRSMVDHTFPLESIPEALTAMSKRPLTGKALYVA